MENSEVKVSQINERVFHVGDNKIYMDDSFIIHYINIGKINSDIAQKSCNVMLELQNLSKAKVHYLIDLNKGRETSLAARRILKEYTETHILGKIAFCGLHPVAKVLASFFLKITKKKEMQFFKTRDEAIIWLQSN